MKPSPKVLAVISAALALGACHDVNRTTSVPRGVDASTILQQDPSGPSADPAPPERGPIPPNANTVAPGTDATGAFGNRTEDASESEPIRDAHVAVQAQEAAAQAQDTASADAAKKEVLARAAAEATGSGGVEPGRDTEENSPRHGALSTGEEANQQPKGGQVNNHSTPSLEGDSGR